MRTGRLPAEDSKAIKTIDSASTCWGIVAESFILCLDSPRLGAAFNLLSLALQPERDPRGPSPWVLISLDESQENCRPARTPRRGPFWQFPRAAFLRLSVFQCLKRDLGSVRQALPGPCDDCVCRVQPLIILGFSPASLGCSYFDINVGFDLKRNKKLRHFPNLGLYYKPLCALRGASRGRRAGGAEGSPTSALRPYHVPLGASADPAMPGGLTHVP